MKFHLTALIVSFFIAASGAAIAQSQTKQSEPSATPPLPPERPLAGSASGLNLKLDDAARRSITTSATEERPANVAGSLPSLGSGARSFDPPGGFVRPKSDARAFPKSVDD